jgi:hypothetical protein
MDSPHYSSDADLVSDDATLPLSVSDPVSYGFEFDAMSYHSSLFSFDFGEGNFTDELAADFDRVPDELDGESFRVGGDSSLVIGLLFLIYPMIWYRHLHQRLLELLTEMYTTGYHLVMFWIRRRQQHGYGP